MHSDLDTRPSKRPRRDDQGVLGPAAEESGSNDAESVHDYPFVKDGELWIRDGNIILVCGGHAFKVHEGVLALNSVVFRDMFKVATSSASFDQSAQERPIVHLDDNVDDVKHILKALYHRDYFQPGLKPVEMTTLASLLHMSTKYIMDIIREDVVQHLQILFPSTLEAYQSPRRTVMHSEDHNPILAVNIAEANDVPSILPCAYYECMMIPLDSILDGLPQPNGDHVSLSPSAQRTCIIARETLRKLVFTRADDRLWIGWDGGDCDDSRWCFQKWEKIRKDAQESHYWNDEYSYDVFATSPSRDWLCSRASQRPCEGSCWPGWTKAEIQGRLHIWSSLPSMIGLGSWPLILKQGNAEANQDDNTG